MKINELKSRNLIIFIFLVMLLVGFITCKDYGQPLDEQWENSLMLANMKEYVVHLPESGIKDKLMNMQKIASIIPISETGEADHGQAAYYPYVVISMVTGKLFNMDNMWILHMYTFAIFMLGVVSLYALAKRIFGTQGKALFAATCFYLTPRMFAEGHYNNKDMVLVAFVLFTLLMGVRMIENDKYVDAIFFGLGAAIATNTKIAGAWFYGITGIIYLFRLIIQKRLNAHTLKVGITAIITFFVGYVLITPGMWDDPVGFIQFLISNANDFTRWDNLVLFNGNLYRGSTNPLPMYYLPWMIVITTPIFILAGVIAGIARLCVDAKKSRTCKEYQMILVLTILWLFPLTYAVVTKTRVYNGWRHFYFVYGPMIFTSIYGIEWIGKCIKNKFVRKCLAGGIIVAMAIGIMLNHPNQQAYYNIFAGSNVESRYELDYWDVSMLNVLKKVKKSANSDEIKIGSCDNWTLAGLRKNLNVIDDEAFILVDWKEADWIVLNPTYVSIYPTEDAASVVHNYKRLYVAKSYGNNVMEVYCRVE